MLGKYEYVLFGIIYLFLFREKNWVYLAANILPSIRDYLNNDRKKIMRVFVISSFIPVILYFVWIAVIQGALPRFGAQGLSAFNNSPNTNSLLMK